MSHQVVWTKRVEDFFCHAANMDEFERDVLRTRIGGMTIVQQSFYFGCSTSTIEKCVARLKKKYDVVQAENPDQLKPRKRCADEIYMDEH